jgi:uncharacterized protein
MSTLSSLPPTLPPLSHLPTLRPGRPPRVVLDTAAVLSALMFGGGAGARLRRGWQLGLCRPLLCKATLQDLMRALAQPRLGLTGFEQRQLLRDYLPHALRVRVPEADREAPAGEPDALAFVRLAMAGKAHVLVSGDTEVLTLDGRLGDCQVMALDAFLAALAAASIEPMPMRRRR